MNIVPTDIAASIDLDLPLPPSVNAAYANNKHAKGRGRYKTERYRVWENAAGWDVQAAKCKAVDGAFVVCLEVPRADRADIDNRLKAALDLLTKHNLIRDDRYAVTALIRKIDDIEKGRARLRVWPA